MKHQLFIDSVTKWAGNKLLLSDIFLSCETGEIVGILGRNGSGKSTLLQIIYGSTDAANKFIKLDGVVLNKLYRKPDTIAYLPQYNFLPLSLSVKKIIDLSIPNKEQTEFYDDALIQ